MSRRPIVAALVAVTAGSVVPALSAHPPNLVDQHGVQIHGKRHQWLHQSRMPLVRGTVRLISAGCPGQPGFSGCVFARRPGTLYLRSGAQNPKSVVYHELGHSFDLRVLRRGERRMFKRILELDGGGWFSGHGPPSELFAEAYALCSRFGAKRPPAGKLGWTHSVYGYRPSPEQHRTVCGMIVRAGARAAPRSQPPAGAPPVVEQKPPQQPWLDQPGGGGGGFAPVLPPLPLAATAGR